MSSSSVLLIAATSLLVGKSRAFCCNFNPASSRLLVLSSNPAVRSSARRRLSQFCAMSSVACNPVSPTFFLDGPGGDGGGGGGGARCLAVAGAIRWLARQEEAIRKEAAEKEDGQLDVWAAIQSSKKAADAEDSAPYVHPLVPRSASSLSQKSLEICTESLGSETGSDGPLSGDDLGDYLHWAAADGDFDVDDSAPVDETEQLHRGTQEPEHLAAPPPPPPPRRKEVAAAVNYHCSVRSSAPPRLFPPPLPSLSRRDGPCLSMRPHRRDGRLVVEAVTVPSLNYLHARRLDGRLLLTLVETTFREAYPEGEEPKARKRMTMHAAEEDEEEMEEEEEEEEEEEVEVVDRGIVVEVKVSRPTTQLQNGGGKLVQRSSVVINKFVGAAIGEEQAAAAAAPSSQAAAKAAAITTTTTATAVVAAAAAASSMVSTDDRYWRYGGASSPPFPEKLFFTSKRTMNRHELLHQVRRCSEHLRPLFILETCYIATT